MLLCTISCYVTNCDVTVKGLQGGPEMHFSPGPALPLAARAPRPWVSLASKTEAIVFGKFSYYSAETPLYQLS